MKAILFAFAFAATLAGDAAQAAEFKRISAKLDPTIRLFSIPGNHDVGNEPTAESLALYRKRFGKDYYSFRIGDIAGYLRASQGAHAMCSFALILGLPSSSIIGIASAEKSLMAM